LATFVMSLKALAVALAVHVEQYTRTGGYD
jgi:hypothetical protein